MYGWYSMNAYIRGEPEYIYYNEDGQETFCTLITEDKKFPLNDKEDYVCCGKILTLSL
jgi:hypothetical protein